MSIYLISLSLLIAAVITVRAIFRRSVSQRVIYALWLVVLLRILMPYQIFAVEMPEFFSSAYTEGGEVTLPPETTASPVIPEVTDPAPVVTTPGTSGVTIPEPVIPEVTLPSSIEPIIPEVTAPHVTPIVPSETTASPAVTPMPSEKLDIEWNKVLYGVWAAGSLIFALVLTVSAMSLSLKLKSDRSYYMNLGRTKVYMSESALSPMIWGLIPAIYVTPDSRGSEPYSLIHEQTHLRHGDHIWSIVRAAVLVAFWWNPLIWAAVLLSKQDAELACDEAIASRLDGDARIEYANVIVDNIPRKSTLAVGLASAPIKERIIMITRKNKTRVLSLLLALVLTLASVGCSFIGPKEPTPPHTTPTADDAVAKLDEKLNKKNTQYVVDIGADKTMLVSYIGDDKEPLLYGTTDGENFNKVVFEIPEKYPYDNAEVAYIYPDKVMVELVYGGVYTYIEFVFDNDESFDGVLSEDECYFVDYLTSPLSFMKMPCTNFPDTKEDGIGPFAAYVESDTADSIDVYTSEGGEKIASIPWNVIADFPATEKTAGWLPYKVWYGEADDFVWAVIAGGVHLGSDNRNFCISRDGGATWDIGDFAATWSGITASAFFISDKIGFMGYERGAYDGIVIARTDDGGKNWNRVEIEIPTGLSDFRQTTPISFKYDGKTLTCTVALKEGVGPDTSVDILSKDGGASWEYEYNWSEKVGTYHTVISKYGTREAHLIPAAMYGYRMGDGIAYTSFETNTNSYWTTLNAGGDTEFYAVFGMQNDYKAQGDFDAYITYHVVARNGRVMKTELVDTLTKELVLEKGKIYSGELKGTYKAKSFSRGDGLTSYTFLFNNGNIELSAYRDGSGAGGTYNGTYTYDKTSGAFEANVRFSSTNNGTMTTSDIQKISGRIYEYDGFIHLIVDKSEAAMIESVDPLPISFKIRERPTDFEMMSNILIGSALTEAQLAGEAVDNDVIRSFIGLSCVSYYRENGFIYSGYWRLIDNNMTWYLSKDDAAKIAYEVFGVENYNGGEIKIPNGTGIVSNNGWRIAVMTEERNGAIAVLTCGLEGDDISQPSDKDFGKYRFTFKYITEGDRGFWRYVGVEEINDENIGHLISENYNVQISDDEKTIRVQKIGESGALVISCGEEKDGAHHVAFLPGSVKMILSEDESTLLLTYISNIDQKREGATLFDLEAKEVRAHYLPTPEEIIKVNDPEGELAEEFQPYLESGQWEINCSAKADAGGYLVIQYELVFDTRLVKASATVSNNYYYGTLRMTDYTPSSDVAEFIEGFERAKEAYYWFESVAPLVKDPTGKIVELRGTKYAPVESDEFDRLGITDPDSLEAYIKTVFTKSMVDEFMSKCVYYDSISDTDKNLYNYLYYDGKLYTYLLGGRGTWPTSEPIFKVKERTENSARISVFVYDARPVDLSELEWKEFEIKFVKSGDRWLCDSFPRIW